MREKDGVANETWEKEEEEEEESTEKSKIKISKIRFYQVKGNRFMTVFNFRGARRRENTRQEWQLGALLESLGSLGENSQGGPPSSVDTNKII